MNRCYLEKPGPADEKAVTDLIVKWRAFGGRMNPGLLRRFGGNYPEWLKSLADWENGVGIGEEAPQTLYLLRRGDGAVLGAVSVRHCLNDSNRTDGGHVGYGIGPEFRGQGYGNLILALALEKLSAMGIGRVLVTCDPDDAASRRIILRSGGVLENRLTDEDGNPVDRYWIDNA